MRIAPSLAAQGCFSRATKTASRVADSSSSCLAETGLPKWLGELSFKFASGPRVLNETEPGGSSVPRRIVGNFSVLDQTCPMGRRKICCRRRTVTRSLISWMVGVQSSVGDPIFQKVDPVAKYYLQSGAFQGVVDRPSIEQAAAWCVDRALESIQFVYNERGWTANQKFDQAILESLLSLGPSIEISERGWNRNDAIRLPTEALVIAWHLRQSENSSVDF